jgi:hypothetical protein
METGIVEFLQQQKQCKNRKKMMRFRILFVAALALPHYATEGSGMDDLYRRLRGIDATSSDLPICKGCAENQFYNIGK